MGERATVMAVGENQFVLDGAPFAGGQVTAFVAKAPSRTDNNEDAVAVIPLSNQTGVVALADGAGGQPGGERASRDALKEIARSIAEMTGDDPNLRVSILDGIESANRAVMEPGIGAATTLEVLEVSDRTIRVYHIGDSATFVIGGRGKIKFQTVPQSPVGYAVEAGLVGQREALFHEDLHLVSNLLGTPETKIEIGPVFSLAKRDTVLVASDGLTDNFTSAEIAEIVCRNPLEKAREILAETSLQRMINPGPEQPSKEDDLSFVLFRQG
jgi:PPM family protein phosphatase